MEAGDTFQAIGTIIKEENLVNVEHSIMPDTLVLESSIPFPGYHGSNLPENPAPESIYLVTNTFYEGEDILRTARNIKPGFPYDFDASFGKAEIFSNTYYFIRVRNLDCFDCIKKIQEKFTEKGIKFMKKKSVRGEALIRLQKIFTLRKIGDHLYDAPDDPSMYYFEIPDKPDWSFFKKITIYIRNNIDNYTYDAALAFIYNNLITDMVRIYAKDITIEQLEKVRSKYLYELSHPDHLD